MANGVRMAEAELDAEVGISCGDMMSYLQDTLMGMEQSTWTEFLHWSREMMGPNDSPRPLRFGRRWTGLRNCHRETAATALSIRLLPLAIRGPWGDDRKRWPENHAT